MIRQHAFSRAPYLVLLPVLLLALNGCGGGGGSGSSANPPPSSGGSSAPPPPTPATVSVGGNVSGLTGSGLVLQNNGGDDLAVNTDGSFVFSNSIASGTGTYNVTIKRRPANPMQTCVVTDGAGTAPSTNITNVVVNCSNDHASFIYRQSGTFGSAGIHVMNEHTGQLRRIGNTPQLPQIAIADPTGRFAYMIPINSDFVYAYAIDAGSGALNEIGAPIRAATAARGAHIHPNGRFLYIAHAVGDRISRFSIADNGVLTLLSPVLLPAGSYPSTSCMTTDGRYLLVGNTGSIAGDTGVSNVTVFAINAGTGDLTSVPGSPFASPVPPSQLSLAVNDSLLYVTSRMTPTTAAYRLNRSTGTLTEMAAPVRSTATEAVVAHPGLPYIYMVANAAGNPSPTVDAFSIDEASGQLSPIQNSTANVGVGFAHTIRIDPSGRLMHVYGSHAAFSFAIDAASGRLTDKRMIGGAGPVPFLTVKVGAQPSMAAKLVFAPTGGTNNVSAFSVDSTSGLLSGVDNSLPGRGSVVHAVTDLRARHLYTANPNDARVYGYNVSADGGISPMISGDRLAITQPTELVMHPTEKLLFAGSVGDRSLHIVSLDERGAMTRLGSIEMLISYPELITSHPDGDVLFVLHGLYLTRYVVEDLNGLVTRGRFREIGGATGLAVHPNGQFLYVVRTSANFIYSYRSNFFADDPPPLSAPTGGSPYKVAIDPSGRFAYVLNRDPAAISGYLVDSVTGALVSMPGSPFAVGSQPNALSFDPAGRTLYISASEGIRTYRVDDRTGALTQIGSSPTPMTPSLVMAAGKSE